MKTTALLVMLVSFQCVWLIDGAKSVGTEFVFGMIPNVRSYTPEDIRIDIASDKEGTLNLQVPYLSINRNETLVNGSNTFTVDGTLIKTGTFKGNRGIYIKTDVPVALYVTNIIQRVMDTFMALPLSSLGTDYIVASYQPYPSDWSEVMLVGVFDNTLVRVTYKDNTESVQTLNRLEVYQIADHSDLSGIKISANKLISVISGASVAVIGGFPGNFLITQLVPYEFWTDSFIIPPLAPNKKMIFKVMWLNSTNFCVKKDTNMYCDQAMFSGDATYTNKDSGVVLTSDSSVSVAQYNVGGGDSDPFMMSLPGIGNYLNRYNFVIPTVYSKSATNFSANNYLCIIIPKSKTYGLLLDGVPFIASRNYSVADPFSNYTILYTPMNVGYHELVHSDGSVTFAALAYGLGRQTGYGFPLGFGYESGATNVCYSCEEMFHVELCETVKKCSEGEICLKDASSDDHDPDTCTECCSESYCNRKGCGESGLPARDLRGPLCYNCEYVYSPEECDTLKLCQEGQVCSIEENEWGTRSNFRMGCAHTSCSPAKRSVNTLWTRSTSVRCLSCCSTDYCNLNCTTASGGNGQPVIVG